MSQNGIEAAMTGRLASAGSTPSSTWHAAAVPTEVARPPATQPSVLRLSLPTTFSVYSPMSLWTATLSDIAAP
jgi:hypothetical protein